LQDLEQVAPADSNKRAAVQDIYYFLRGKAMEDLGQTKDAAAFYKQSLSVARGSFGKMAFESWLKSYVKDFPEKVSEDILAKLILAELDGELSEGYLNRTGLFKKDALGRELKRLVPDAMIRSVPIRIAGKEASLAPQQLAKSLTVIVSAVENECGKNEADASFDTSAFSGQLLKFWNAAILRCKGQLSVAAEEFAQVLAGRTKNELSLSHYWYASQQRIVALRGIGKRQDAGDEYVRLMKIWDEGKLSNSDLGMGSDEFILQRINDALWASRYRALIGDLVGAKTYGLSALHLVNQSFTKISREGRKQITEYKAEAYHTLSSRVALEEQKFDEAITYATLGSEIPEITREWQDRFAWTLGFYNYLTNNHDAAIRHWENLFKKTSSEELKPQLYFWLAKLHYDAGRRQEGDFYYHALTEEHPLNFYSVVAPELAEFSEPERWKSVFDSAFSLAQELMSTDRFQLDALRHDPALADLLLRAEIVIAAGLDEKISHTCINELSRAMRANYRMADKAYPLYVYLSRLHYAASQYVEAISLTSQLQGGSRSFWEDWSDQITVYFPQPYMDVFTASSELSNVSTDILMGIARQETSFRPHAISGAGAIGMMQLIPVTARRMAEEIGIEATNVDTKLTDPRLNTALGSSYVRFLDRYYKGFKPAVYAAYNAGEYAVDQWLERRQHSSVLGFIELMPFSETKGYVRNVMRNVKVYEFLNRTRGVTAQF
jgi:soluble lytic murein transglycosylase